MADTPPAYPDKVLHDHADHGLDTEFTRGLGLFDATMIHVGSMIGSGIFVVSAEAWADSSAVPASCSSPGSSPIC